MTNITPMPPPAWRDRLQISSNGSIKNNIYNAMCAVRGMRPVCGRFYYDEFRSVVLLESDAPWGSLAGAAWTEEDDVHFSEFVQGAGIGITPDILRPALDTVAREHPRHDLRDWLSSLQWDGRMRIHEWLTYFLGVDKNAYTEAVGRAWLISAVARVMRPGCKADHMLILDGPQGAGKSTAVRTLAGVQYFTDEIAEFGSKDASMSVAGAWIVEVSELAAFGTAAMERVKAFVTRQVDRFRPPYGKRIITQPRQCVFVGTSNNTEFRDPTGNRRFWPVTVSAIDIDALRREREQIWAEAVAAYHRGEQWWLTDPCVISAAVNVQRDRMQGDPWDDVIAEWLLGKVDVSIPEILEGAIKLSTEKWSRREEMRVSDHLKARGWVRFLSRRMGIRSWRYRCPS